MADSALEDFLKRFGDSDPNKFMTQNQTISPMAKTMSSYATMGRPTASSLINNLNLKGLTSLSGESKIEDAPELDPKSTGLEEEDMSFSELASKGSDLLQAAPSVMGLINNAKGGQFDTSAEGGGPGKAGGAILMGATQGADAGEKIGSVIGGPIGGTIGKIGGAVFGGLTSTFAHTKAMKEWRKNQIKHNLGLNALEKAKHREEYAISEGLASMENLKNLREKQLGILS